MRKDLLLSSCIAIGVSFGQFSKTSAIAADNSPGKAQAAASILIEASPKLVWKAVHTERQQDPDIAYSKVLQDCGNNTTLLEQKFVNIPVFGSVTAVTRQVEELDHRIDYSLVRSNKFKALDGSWELTAVNGGKETVLRLHSSLDLGIPFSSILIKGATQKKLERRLAHVKHLAESDQARVATSGDLSNRK